MSSSAGDVDERLVRLLSVTFIFPTLKPSAHSCTYGWSLARWISARLTLSAYRKRTAERCASMVHLLSGVYIHLYANISVLYRIVKGDEK